MWEKEQKTKLTSGISTILVLNENTVPLTQKEIVQWDKI